MGLEAAKEFRPDLILLDVIMPDIDGGQVAAQIKADSQIKDTPIVFLTAIVSKKETVSLGSNIGGQAFITKPLSPNEIVTSIEKHLKKPLKIESHSRSYQQEEKSHGDGERTAEADLSH